MFENVIQACADLAQHVATHDLEFDGDTSKGAIRTLGQEDVIDEQTMQTLISAVGFRNVLAHEYGRVDYTEVYRALQTELVVYEDFSRQVAQWFRQED